MAARTQRLGVGKDPVPLLPLEPPSSQLLSPSFPWDSLLLFGGLPLLATLFPPLVHVAKDAAAAPGAREAAIAAILVGKRIFIYLLAFTVVALAGLRGATDPPQFGTRLSALTAEVLGLDSALGPGQDDRNEGLPGGASLSSPSSRRLLLLPTRKQLSQQLEVLDAVSPEAQAGGLPLLVGGSLAASLALLQLPTLLERLTAASDSTLQSPDESGTAWVANVAAAVVAAAPTLVVCSNALVLALFTRAELQRAGGASGATRSAVPVRTEEEFGAASAAGALSGATLALAVLLTAAAFALPAAWAWPARNVVREITLLFL